MKTLFRFLPILILAPMLFAEACSDAQAVAPSQPYTKRTDNQWLTGAVHFDGAIRNSVSSPNGDTTLTTTACGSEQFIGAAGDDFTLPAPTAGCSIRFTVDANFAATSMTIVTASSANVIYGAVNVNSTLVPCADEDTITIVNSAELPGDFVQIWSNGTSWYVSGVGVTVGSITCTQAS